MAIQLGGLDHYNEINWSAIIAGGLASATFAILLSILGVGLGLSVISPWSNVGAGAATIGISAIIWLSVTQIIASGMGGFLAGRLRAKWFGVHVDEVYFTDSVHGFLTWAIALIISVILFTSFLGSFLDKGIQSAEIYSNSMSRSHHQLKTEGLTDDAETYYLESLFRPNNDVDKKKLTTLNDNKMLEVRRVFSQSLKNGSVSPDDLSYLSQLVSENTGLPKEEAEKNVNQAFNDISEAKLAMKVAADDARKASAYTTLWAFIALLIGAFSASYSAVLGGRYRNSDFHNS